MAKLHGDSLNGAVKTALREKLARDKHELIKEERFGRLMALSREFSSRSGPRTMTDDEAIGYDENGLPS